MYKLFFEILKQPLGLPISPIYEYILLLVIGEIAFQIAWKLSPGGHFGSEIHWLVRVPTFLALWFVLYAAILIVKLVIAHWIFVLSVMGGITVLALGVVILIRRNRAMIK